jgi:hypothetical protein
MDKDAHRELREKARNWTCHNFAIAEHGGDTAALLRKAADAIEQLGDIEILDIAFRRPMDPPALELTVSVYFYFRSDPRESGAVKSTKALEKSSTCTTTRVGCSDLPDLRLRFGNDIVFSVFCDLPVSESSQHEHLRDLDRSANCRKAIVTLRCQSSGGTTASLKSRTKLVVLRLCWMARAHRATV